MASIKIPTPLRTYTQGKAEIAVDGSTVRDVLDHLLAQYPDLRPHLFHEEKLRDFVNVFVADENITDLDGMDTTVSESTRLRIIPSIAGGLF